MTKLKQPNGSERAELAELNKVYQKLQNVISQWQKERGQHWAKNLIPNRMYPYFSLSSIPEEPILELVERLLEESKWHGSAEELHSLWSRYLFEQRLEDSELFSRFTLAVQGVLGLARRCLPEDLLLAAGNETGQVCPICGQEAGLALLVPPVGKRVLHCTSCGHEWPGKRIGCIHCGSEEASEQTYLKNEDFPGVEIVVCQTCGGSFKEVDLRERKVEDLVWENIRTLPLNYAADKWLHEQTERRVH